MVAALILGAAMLGVLFPEAAQASYSGGSGYGKVSDEQMETGKKRKMRQRQKQRQKKSKVRFICKPKSSKKNASFQYNNQGSSMGSSYSGGYGGSYSGGSGSSYGGSSSGGY
jgi:hypothetical protein